MIDYLSKAVCMHDKVSRAFKHKVSSKKRTDTEEEGIWRDPRYIANPMGAPNAQNAALLTQNVTENSTNRNEANANIETRLRKMEDAVSKVTSPGTEERDYDVRMLRIQWRNIAIVMDRCFFVLYAITIVITTCILFPRPT